MKNKIVLLLFLLLFGFSVFNEPLEDTADIIAGATNDTYGTSPDVLASASDDYDEDDDDDEEYEEDED